MGKADAGGGCAGLSDAGAARGVAEPASASRSPGGRCGTASTSTVPPRLGAWKGLRSIDQ